MPATDDLKPREINFPAISTSLEKKIGSVFVRENRHQSGGLLNLLGMTESFSSDFSADYQQDQ
jgi:hypothetical protein